MTPLNPLTTREPAEETPELWPQGVSFKFGAKCCAQGATRALMSDFAVNAD